MNEPAVKAALYQWLHGSLGERHVFTIDFDADFVAGNVIDGSFDAEAITSVPWQGTQADTMLALATEIQKRAVIFKAKVTGARQVTVTGAISGDPIAVVGPIVTGGASQPVATVTTVTDPEDVTVIFSDQSSPRPNYPYAVIRIDSVVKIGWDEMRDQDPDTFITTIGGQRRATVSVSYFGTNPLREASKAYNALEKRTVLDQLYAAGLAVLEKGPIQNLTGVLETKFESRADFDFFIGFADNVEDDLGVIETAELTGEIQNGVNGPVVVGPDIIGV